MRYQIKSRRIFILILAIFWIAVFWFAHFASAQGVDVFGGKQTEVGGILGLGAQDPRITIAKIIRVILGFLGILAVGLTLYGGWIWMSSEGNEQKIEEAKKILRNAVIGLLIILSSFGIVSFILNKILETTGAGGPGGGPGGAGGGGMAVLGAGIVQSHYPERNATGIPRNTKVVITFREPILVNDLVSGGLTNDANIYLYETRAGQTSPHVANVTATATPDRRTFIFKPAQPLGSPSSEVSYTAVLSSNVRKENGQPAFGGAVSPVGYSWPFEVSTFMDVTPPKVESVIPEPASTEPRNVVVQINFSEAVDPLTASGLTAAGFDNLSVAPAIGAPVAGGFYISNQYKTVEFITDDACGTNSCGKTIYCLPGNAALTALVQAATLALAGQPGARLPADGVADMADNSLDGNGDGAADGPTAQSTRPPYDLNAPAAATQGDDLRWAFNTNNTIDITPPEVTAITPGSGQAGVGLSDGINATFNKLLTSSSLAPGNVALDSAAPVNFWLSKFNVFPARQTVVAINHDQFSDNAVYWPKFRSGVTDIYQNCFQPCSGLGAAGAPSCCNLAPSGGVDCP